MTSLCTFLRYSTLLRVDKCQHIFYDLFAPDSKLDLWVGAASEAFRFSQLLSTFMGDFHVVFRMEDLGRYVTFRDRLSESNRKGDNSVLPLYSDWQEDSGVLR